jgi:outer membrane protein insertion porin family
MRTDERPRVAPRSLPPTVPIVFVLFLFGATGTAIPAQVPDGGGTDGDEPERSFFLYDDETTVESVDFRFLATQRIETNRLEEVIAYDGPGALAGLRKALDPLPFISAPTLDVFDPLTLQRDVVRMRRAYRSEGYPDAEIDYEVTFDEDANAVSITFVIDEGEPVTVGEVEPRIVQEGFSLPEELHPAWRELVNELSTMGGQVLGDGLRIRIDDEATDWLRWQGYPWGIARVVVPDTVDHRARVLVNLVPGTRARVDSIVVEGNTRLSQRVIRREIPFAAGDWYDSRAVTRAQEEIYELALVNRVLGEVPPQPHDTTVTVRFRVNESQPRLVWARAGWRSASGIAGEAHWTHRDFFGNARTFTASVNAESGLGALEVTRSRTIGASLLVRQPYVWHRSVSASIGPFVQFRDDYRDRSLLYGVETTVLYQYTALETFSLQHEISRTRVDDAFQLLPMARLVAEGDTAFAPIFVRSVFRIGAMYGRLDDRFSPRSGFFVRPSAEFTGPPGVSDVDFVRLSVDALLAVPLDDQVAVFLRGTAGRLFPFGDSDPARPDAATRVFAGLRDALFTAGGTADLRGWGRGLAGSKIPDVIVAPDGTARAERYVPVGGLALITGGLEVELPFPLLPAQHRTYTFLDAGRVWSPGNALQPGDPELAVAPWLYAVGGGMQFSTFAGPIRVGLGYKLNPTRIDLLSPDEVARALAAGQDLGDIEREQGRRWHFMISIGRGL